MAFAVIGAVSLAIGSMYYAGVKSKAEEGPASVYHEGKRPLTESDSKMGSSQVRDTMHKTKVT
jgi:hypothetical protein